MDIPTDLKIAIEKITIGKKHAQLMRDSQKLSVRYRANSGDGKSLLKSDQEAIAYSVVRMPATFGSILTALKYALELSGCRPTSLMDVGAGTGSAVWAANTLLDLQDIVCLEREDAMIGIGKELMNEANHLLCNTK